MRTSSYITNGYHSPTNSLQIRPQKVIPTQIEQVWWSLFSQISFRMVAFQWERKSTSINAENTLKEPIGYPYTVNNSVSVAVRVEL